MPYMGNSSIGHEAGGTGIEPVTSLGRDLGGAGAVGRGQIVREAAVGSSTAVFDIVPAINATAAQTESVPFSASIDSEVPVICSLINTAFDERSAIPASIDLLFQHTIMCCLPSGFPARFLLLPDGHLLKTDLLCFIFPEVHCKQRAIAAAIMVLMVNTIPADAE